MQDGAWDKRCHSRLGQAACSTRLGVTAGHWPSHKGQCFGAPSLEPREVSGDDSRAQGVSSDLTKFSNATPLLSKHRGWPRPPRGRHPGHCMGKGSTEGSCTRSATQKCGSRKTRSQRGRSPQPGPAPGAGGPGAHRLCWAALCLWGIPVVSPESRQSLQNPTRSFHSQA